MNRRELLASGLALVGAKALGQTSIEDCLANKEVAGPCIAKARRKLSLAPNFGGISQAVLKRGYDNTNSGCNLHETKLNHGNVGQIRQLFSLPMEGDRVGGESQPLIAPSVLCDDGTVRDLLIQGSMNNLLYAFDANRSDIVWVKKLAVPVNGNNKIDWWNINDHWGMLSTGVIDPDTNYFYGVCWSDPNGNPATAIWQMHVIDLRNGNRVCPPITVTSNKPVWNVLIRKQRSSLLLTNVHGVKTIFFASGTVSESAQGAAGWIFAFDVASNTFATDLAMTEGEGAGIWMAGGSMCADAAGYLYAVTGNGGFDGNNNFGESIVKIKYTPKITGSPATLQVIGCKTLWTDIQRESNMVSRGAMHSEKLAGINAATAVNNAGWYDEDLGSAPPVLFSNGWLLACGKDGISYLVDTNNMGMTTLAQVNNPVANYATLVQPPQWLTYFPGYQYNPAPAKANTLDFLPDGKTRHMHSCPVVYNGKVFVWGENSPCRVFSITANGLQYLATGAINASAQITNSPGGMPGGFMCLSANGTTTGTAILWACIPDGDANKTVTTGRVYAMDAEHLQNGIINVLWTSPEITFNKFCPPVVSGGKLYVNTYADEVLCFG